MDTTKSYNIFHNNLILGFKVLFYYIFILTYNELTLVCYENVLRFCCLYERLMKYSLEQTSRLNSSVIFVIKINRLE